MIKLFFLAIILALVSSCTPTSVVPDGFMESDTTAPTVDSVTTTTTTGAYVTATEINVTVNFSEAVTVLGTPTITLNTTPARSASYVSGSGTSALVFTYTVQANDTDARVDYTATTALTAGTSIKDATGLDAVLTLPATGASGLYTTNIAVDAIVPTVDSVTTTTATGTHYTAEAINVTVNFSEAITVVGTPTITLNTTPARSASYVSGTGTTALVFTYTTQVSDADARVDYTATTALSAGTSIKDSAGNNATLTLPATGSSGLYTTNIVIKPSFVSVWQTTAPAESITLPLRTGFTYNLSVDWGDGSALSSVTAWNDVDITHTYATAGEYIVILSGTAGAWYFNNGGSKLKILRVTELGDLGWINFENAFLGCTNLTTLSGGVTSNVTNMYQMFHFATGLTSLDLSTFNTTNVTNMSYMFRNVSSLTSLDLSSFNTTNVTNMSYMFSTWASWYAASLTSINLSSFNTANVTNMEGMFSETYTLTSLDLSSFITTSVTTMANMFAGTTLLTSLDISNFNTTTVTNMSQMFYNARAITTLDLSHFNTTNVTNMSSMFSNTDLLVNLDISSFRTPNVTTMASMFNGAKALTSLNLSLFNTGNVTNMNQMFHNISSITSLDLSSFDTTKVTNMSYMFSTWAGWYSASLTSINLSSFNTANVTNMEGMFGSTYSITSLNLSNFNTSKVTNMNAMFYNYYSGIATLTSLNTTGWDLTLASGSTNVFNNANAGLVVTCNQGGSPATGTFFGSACQ